SEFAETRKDCCQKLDNDAGSDVRHDPESADSALLERATSEQTVHSNDRVRRCTPVKVEPFTQRRTIQSGNRNPRNNAANSENENRENNPRLEFRNFEAVRKRVEDVLKHLSALGIRLGRRGCRCFRSDFAGATLCFDLLAS